MLAGEIDINVEAIFQHWVPRHLSCWFKALAVAAGMQQKSVAMLIGQRDAAGDASAGLIKIDTRNNASFNSLKEDSAAFVVQSVGGGGGQVSATKGDLLLGSTGSGDMSSGDITLEGAFTATTQGNQSPAVVLQSIGGGGAWRVQCLGPP